MDEIQSFELRFREELVHFLKQVQLLVGEMASGEQLDGDRQQDLAQVVGEFDEWSDLLQGLKELEEKLRVLLTDADSSQDA
jgi:hypothetical protein